MWRVFEGCVDQYCSEERILIRPLEFHSCMNVTWNATGTFGAELLRLSHLHSEHCIRKPVSKPLHGWQRDGFVYFPGYFISLN